MGFDSSREGGDGGARAIFGRREPVEAFLLIALGHVEQPSGGGVENQGHLLMATSHRFFVDEDGLDAVEVGGRQVGFEHIAVVAPCGGCGDAED